MKTRVMCAMTATATLLVAACASGPPRQTVVNLTRAHSLISEAERGGAQEYAPADLQAARDKAQQADELSRKGNAKEADQLANEAAADAQLAAALAARDKARHDVADMNRTLGTLREEEQRNTSAPPMTAPNGNPPPAPQSGATPPLEPQSPPP